MTIWIHLNDGTYFSGSPDDEVWGSFALVKLKDLAEGDHIRVAGWRTGDFPGERVGIYKSVLLIREVE